ncbi:hypothetical protein BBX50_23540 [Ensifer sp. LC11]|nr:hypothetical protein BBX50_23540 [Ensifer sp. LC11]
MIAALKLFWCLIDDNLLVNDGVYEGTRELVIPRTPYLAAYILMTDRIRWPFEISEEQVRQRRTFWSLRFDSLQGKKFRGRLSALRGHRSAPS